MGSDMVATGESRSVSFTIGNINPAVYWYLLGPEWLTMHALTGGFYHYEGDETDGV